MARMGLGAANPFVLGIVSLDMKQLIVATQEEGMVLASSQARP